MFLLAWLATAERSMSQGIEVIAADPLRAEQGTLALDVEVTGSGVERGAMARFLVTGTREPGGITVKSAKLRGRTKHIATTDMAPDATVSEFDVEVENNDGRRGVGIELFGVNGTSALSGTIYTVNVWMDDPHRDDGPRQQ